MAPITTRAIVLHTFPYGESSKIVRLATREYGVVSVIAKGAHRPKSAFGASLQPLSEGMARVYIKQHRDLQTLAEFELVGQRQELSHDLHRYAAAAALCELVLHFSPQEPHPEIFELLHEALDSLAAVERERVSEVGLATLWSVVSALGFAPAVSACAVDGAPIPPGRGEFSVHEGGMLCAACARSRETARLPSADRERLEEFVSGRVPDEPLAPRHAAAHRRLLVRFVTRHVAEGRELPALTFWESRR